MLYHVFSLRLRDVELLLAERGVVVSHETVRRWSKEFGHTFASRANARCNDSDRQNKLRSSFPPTHLFTVTSVPADTW